MSVWTFQSEAQAAKQLTDRAWQDRKPKLEFASCGQGADQRCAEFAPS